MASGEGVSAAPDLDREAVRSVLEEYPLRLAILFGSHARGTAHPGSDVDLGVVFAEDVPTDRRQALYLDLHSTAAAALGTDAVDVTLLDDVPPSVGRQALGAYEVLLGDPALAEQLRERYERAAPRPSHEDLLERLDEGLAAIDAALGGRSRERADQDGG